MLTRRVRAITHVVWAYLTVLDSLNQWMAINCAAARRWCAGLHAYYCLPTDSAARYATV